MIRALLITALLLICNVASATDILLTWDAATKRVDQSLITGQKEYRIYQSVDKVAKQPVTLPGTVLSHTILDVVPGTYVFQISTVEDGYEGAKSVPCAKTVNAAPGADSVRCEVVQ